MKWRTSALGRERTIVGIPAQIDHPFRRKSSTDSGLIVHPAGGISPAQDNPLILPPFTWQKEAGMPKERLSIVKIKEVLRL